MVDSSVANGVEVSMVFKDDEIERFRQAEQSRATKAQQEAAEKRRIVAEFKKKMKEAKKAKDRRGYERLLELQNVGRQSPEWKAFWNWFYSDET